MLDEWKKTCSSLLTGGRKMETQAVTFAACPARESVVNGIYEQAAKLDTALAWA
jgi:hypothetical protein